MRRGSKNGNLRGMDDSLLCPGIPVPVLVLGKCPSSRRLGNSLAGSASGWCKAQQPHT
jgi:hypothetical protein